MFVSPHPSHPPRDPETFSSCSFITPGHFVVTTVCLPFLTLPWQPRTDISCKFTQITNFQMGHYNNNFFQFSLEIIIAVLQYFTPHLLGQKVPISSLYLRNYSREGMKHLCCEIKHYLFSVTFTYQLSRNIPLNIYSL